uniref:Uncharacterized protein n=1 Tax=Sphaerodactylus townsendi TaxID=933632 RepID=A0ACB8F488_9SAUR
MRADDEDSLAEEVVQPQLDFSRSHVASLSKQAAQSPVSQRPRSLLGLQEVAQLKLSRSRSPSHSEQAARPPAGTLLEQGGGHSFLQVSR